MKSLVLLYNAMNEKDESKKMCIRPSTAVLSSSTFLQGRNSGLTALFRMPSPDHTSVPVTPGVDTGAASLHTSQKPQALMMVLKQSKRGADGILEQRPMKVQKQYIPYMPDS